MAGRGLVSVQGRVLRLDGQKRDVVGDRGHVSTPLAEEHHVRRPQNDFQIHAQRPVLDVEEVR